MLSYFRSQLHIERVISRLKILLPPPWRLFAALGRGGQGGPHLCSPSVARAAQGHNNLSLTGFRERLPILEPACFCGEGLVATGESTILNGLGRSSGLPKC